MDGFERALRNELYAHVQSLPVSFHDRWHSGQLLSRAMADLSVIRRFVGFGLVFLVVNTVTFVLVIGLPFRLYAPLAVVVRRPILPQAHLAMRFKRRYKEVSRRVQDQQGDLRTLVEEVATVIRVVTGSAGREPVWRIGCPPPGLGHREDQPPRHLLGSSTWCPT